MSLERRRTVGPKDRNVGVSSIEMESKPKGWIRPPARPREEKTGQRIEPRYLTFRRRASRLKRQNHLYRRKSKRAKALQGEKDLFCRNDMG